MLKKLPSSHGEEQELDILAPSVLGSYAPVSFGFFRDGCTCIILCMIITFVELSLLISIHR